MELKRWAILLLSFTMLFHSIYYVCADSATPQLVEITVAETGAVEDFTHPFVFGQEGVWEVSVDRFQATNGDSMQLDATQLGYLLSIGAIQGVVKVNEGRRQLAQEPTLSSVDNCAVLTISPRHTYGTRDQEYVLGIRLQVLRNVYWNQETQSFTGALYSSPGVKNTLMLRRGTELNCGEKLFTASYRNLTNYRSRLNITQKDVDNGHVLADGEEMYMATGIDRMLTFCFGDYAEYTTCISAAQPQVNLFYSTRPWEEISEMYQLELRFIQFLGSPSFVNSGELTFPAIGGEDTVVYSYDGELLTPLIAVYNAQTETVTVRGVRRLGSYVVAEDQVEKYEVKQESNSPVAVPIRLPERTIRVEQETNPITGENPEWE